MVRGKYIYVVPVTEVCLMARAIWKGAISFGLVTIPVGLVSAEDTKSDIAFHMLDKKTMSRVKQKRVDESTGEEVQWDDIVKGYEYESGRYVVLEPEEIEAANPKATHTIDIVAVVCRECIEPVVLREAVLRGARHPRRTQALRAAAGGRSRRTARSPSLAW